MMGLKYVIEANVCRDCANDRHKLGRSIPLHVRYNYSASVTHTSSCSNYVNVERGT